MPQFLALHWFICRGEKDIWSQSCISWAGFKILRSLGRKKQILYSFLRRKRSRLWAEYYTDPLRKGESCIARGSKGKTAGPSAPAHLRRAGGGGADGAEMGEWPLRPWERDSSWGSMKQPTPWRTPFCPAPVKELFSGKIQTEKQTTRKTDGAQSVFINLKWHFNKKGSKHESDQSPAPVTGLVRQLRAGGRKKRKPGLLYHLPDHSCSCNSKPF